MNDDDDRIRDLLDSAAPDRPDLPPAARTLAVTRRARAVRRRHRLVLATAVAAVVGVGVGVPTLTSGGDDDTRVAGDPAPSKPTRSLAAHVFDSGCPPDPPAVDGPANEADFPPGAEVLRLCPASSELAPPGTTGFTLPTKPLLHDADAVLDDIAALPAFALPDECALTTPVVMPWALVAYYPDGRIVSVGSTTTLCSSITVDGRTVDAAAALALVEDAITAEDGEPRLGTSVVCPAPDEIEAARTAPDELEGSLAGFEPTVGLVCYVPDPMGVREYANDEGALVGADLALVVDDLRAGTTPEATVAGRCVDSGPTRVLVLAETQGGRLTRVDASCTTEFAGGGTYWLPGPEAEAVLDEALGGRTQ